MTIAEVLKPYHTCDVSEMYGERLFLCRSSVENQQAGPPANLPS
jgi:hypothetical protein